MGRPSRHSEVLVSSWSAYSHSALAKALVRHHQRAVARYWQIWKLVASEPSTNGEPPARSSLLSLPRSAIGQTRLIWSGRFRRKSFRYAILTAPSRCPRPCSSATPPDPYTTTSTSNNG